MKVISIQTNHKDEVLDLNSILQFELATSHVTEGVCLLHVLHTTCSLTIANMDPGTDQDLLDVLRKLLPPVHYRHPHNPGHAPDHILSAMIGPSISIPIHDGHFVLGTYQRIVLIELDGPRERHLSITLLHEAKIQIHA